MQEKVSFVILILGNYKSKQKALKKKDTLKLKKKYNYSKYLSRIFMHQKTASNFKKSKL